MIIIKMQGPQYEAHGEQRLPAVAAKSRSVEQTQASYERLVAANILARTEDGTGYIRVQRQSLPGIVQIPAQIIANLERRHVAGMGEFK